jgi:hypothetical protein
MKLLLTVTAASLISAGAGAVVGYKVAERRLTLHFEERILRETAGMRVFYSQAKQPFDTPEEALAAMVSAEQESPESPASTTPERVAYHKIVKSYVEDNPPEESEGPRVDFTPPPVEPHVQNFFDKPVIISQDEFVNEESGYMQGTLVYYVQDGALCDERDQLIESIDDVVGADNLRFGEQSSDENTVHVRNPKLQLEWEIVRNHGSYGRDVQGIVEPPSGRSR